MKTHKEGISFRTVVSDTGTWHLVLSSYIKSICVTRAVTTTFWWKIQMMWFAPWENRISGSTKTWALTLLNFATRYSWPMDRVWENVCYAREWWSGVLELSWYSGRIVNRSTVHVLQITVVDCQQKLFLQRDGVGILRKVASALRNNLKCGACSPTYVTIFSATILMSCLFCGLHLMCTQSTRSCTEGLIFR